MTFSFESLLTFLGVAVLALLAVVLFQLVFILRDVSALSRLARKTGEQVSGLILQPVRFLSFLFDTLKKTAGGIDVAELIGEALPGKKRRAKK